MSQIAAWLRRPHVRRWWGDPEHELALICEALPDPSWRPYLVSLAGRPFAYIQCYDLQADANKLYGGQPPGTRGIDFFIGKKEMTGRGHGAAMLARFAAAAFRYPNVPRIISDPDPANTASVGALRHAGFVDSGVIATPGGDARLMVRSRAPKTSV